MNEHILHQGGLDESFRSYQGGSGYVPNNEQLLQQAEPTPIEGSDTFEDYSTKEEDESLVKDDDDEDDGDSELGDLDGDGEEIEESQDSPTNENEDSDLEEKPPESDSDSDDDKPLAFRQLKKTLHCTQCSFKTTNSDEFMKHQSTHEDFLQTCAVCNVDFKLEWDWFHHLREVHASALWLGPNDVHRKNRRGKYKKRLISKFVCSKCHYKAYSKSAMKEHLRIIHHKTNVSKLLSSRPASCAKCDFQAASDFHLKKHINLAHMNEVKPKHILCEMCGAKMMSRKSYENHLESIHRIYENGKPTEYLCDQCPYKVKSRGALYSHVRDKHRKGIVTEHKCPHCDFSSTRKSNIKNHLFTKHTDESTLPKYKCPICDYETKYKNVIPMHVRKIHRKDEQPLHYCTLCDFSTIHPYNLKKHQLVHKDREEVKIYKCPHCKYETRHKHGVVTHMLVHTPAEQTTMYRCDLCNFQTKYKFGLQQHMRSSLHKNNTAKCGVDDDRITLANWADTKKDW